MIINKLRQARKGFTLVELLVVVLVIGVLLAIALPLYQGATRSAASGTVKANIRAMFTAAQTAKTKNLPMTQASVESELGGPITKPDHVTYVFASTAGANTITASEDNTNDVFGTSAVNDTIVYSWNTGEANGTFTP